MKRGLSNFTRWGNTLVYGENWNGNTSDEDVKRFRPMLDFIARHEGTADQRGHGYNTSLGFGIFIPGGEKVLISMTLLQIDVLQTQMLNNRKNHFNSSALGRFKS